MIKRRPWTVPAGELQWHRDMAAIGRARWRDIPATCMCEWEYRLRTRRYVRVTPARWCPWHSDTCVQHVDN